MTECVCVSAWLWPGPAPLLPRVSFNTPCLQGTTRHVTHNEIYCSDPHTSRGNHTLATYKSQPCSYIFLCVCSRAYIFPLVIHEEKATAFCVSVAASHRRVSGCGQMVIFLLCEIGWILGCSALQAAVHTGGGQWRERLQSDWPRFTILKIIISAIFVSIKWFVSNSSLCSPFLYFEQKESKSPSAQR